MTIYDEILQGDFTVDSEIWGGSGMDCREGCAACCIVVSISSPIPGMPGGKPAGMPCVQLTADKRCSLFGKPERPKVCLGLQPSKEMCGESSEEAYTYLENLEEWTRPTGTRE
jgi:Fe-S-cluster containining protein